MALPAWLPDLISMNGDDVAIYQRLYEVFRKDFIDGDLSFQNCPVWWNRTIKEGEAFQEGFLHITTREEASKGRMLDYERASRLSWCAPIIRNSDDGCVKKWEEKESTRKIKTYLWLEGGDYVVILQKKNLPQKDDLPEKEVYFLITAYHVDGNSRRRQLQKKYRYV